MWLLSTHRAELHFFPTANDVPRGYAILSHVWDHVEQSFQDVQALRDRYTATGLNPRDFASPKIRNFCILAEQHGYDWVWIDTCCIDKSSSAELSEAINSMFRWYSLAETCYAYLADVPSYSNDPAGSRAFRQSKWHTRGWTLQELIAPDVVVVTNIPVNVLRLQMELSSVSIAARMSWAAKRKTTRPEDEAYCLMGIFRINMPTLYGEGRQAFQRLQEEIMRRSTDTTLFAWGTPSERLPDLLWNLQDDLSMVHGHIEGSCLFASGPSAFRSSADVVFTPHLQNTSARWRLSKTLTVPTFSNNAYGVRAHLPVIETKIPRVIIAVLFCSSSTQRYGLLLHTCSEATSPLGSLYDTGIPTLDRQAALRLVPLDEDDDPNLDKVIDMSKGYVVAEWRDVYIRALQPPYRTIQRIPVNRNTSFYIPRWLLKEYAGQLIRQGSGPTQPGPLPATFLFYADPKHHSFPFLLNVGRCTYPSGTRWANVVRFENRSPTASQARLDIAPSHDCTLDHIRSWPDHMRDLDLAFSPPPDPWWSSDPRARNLATKYFTVKIRFTPSPINADTRLWHLEVGGDRTMVEGGDAGSDTRSPEAEIVPLPPLEVRRSQSGIGLDEQLQESEVLDPIMTEFERIHDGLHG
ncbi:HET-domain-containing protein [Dichomitus squalens]|uniref:HET-domain-containing protein n=1 Tax=Dichomitus squalens TaxID=114155 RepID=A0A4Q9MV18_9APHY|nr:HET-domain-containing protein [Dichomitus squalens]